MKIYSLCSKLTKYSEESPEEIAEPKATAEVINCYFS